MDEYEYELKAEFVKIVRCKNCIHYGEFLSTEPKHEKYCNMLDWLPDEDDFCSRGETNETGQ